MAVQARRKKIADVRSVYVRRIIDRDIYRNSNFEMNVRWSRPGTGEIGSDIHLIRYRVSTHLAHCRGLLCPALRIAAGQGYERVTLAKVASLYLHMQVTRVLEWKS